MLDEMKSDDQTIRLFLAEHYADPDIEGEVMVRNLDLIWKWVKSGALPSASVTQLKVK